MNSLRNIQFEPKAFEEFIEWAAEDKKIFFKIAEFRRHPFEGKGKPEPLKHGLKGFFSRRITDKHRVIYSVKDDTITFIAFKHHYGDK